MLFRPLNMDTNLTKVLAVLKNHNIEEVRFAWSAFSAMEFAQNSFLTCPTFDSVKLAEIGAYGKKLRPTLRTV